MYDIIIEISSSKLAQELMELMYSKIKSTKTWNELEINLLKQFSINAMTSQFMNQDIHTIYGIEIFWELMLDSSELDNSLKDKVLEGISDIFRRIFSNEKKEEYLIKSIDLLN